MHSESLATDIHHDHSNAIDVFGFWLYIMTDCVLFGCLFAVFLVLHAAGVQGPSLKPLLDLPHILIETFLLLASNFIFCLAVLNLHHNKLLKTQCWLLITLLLGAGFVAMELTEFAGLATQGYRWDVSGQASSFFTLVGTHGLHVSIGLCWMLILIIQLFMLGITDTMKRRLTYLGLFWNFLDIVWIFVFTIVYLMEYIQ